jgi:hypothetical protein
MIYSPAQEWRRKHFNRPQRRSMIVRAKYEVAVLARGVGKTEGIMAPRWAHNAFAMRRSTGALITPTFKKLFTEVIPSIYSGLEELGYIEGRHFTIGKPGPDHWPKPYKKPRDWSHAMHWCVGSARAFVSQDREGMGNGLSVDDITVEEAKLVNGQRFNDSTRQILRGGLQHFADRPEHQSLLFVSDRPTTPEQKWFLSYAKGHDPELINLILQGAYKQQQWIEAIRGGQISQRTVEDYTRKIQEMERDLDQLRGVATYYHEASALDNIEIIGWDNFLDMEKRMPPRLFATSIMNEELDDVQGTFYPDYLEDRNTYLPAPTSWTTDRGVDRDRLTARDCRHDAEIISSLPIDIGMDYGGRINCLVVGQMWRDELRVDNDFHVITPGRTRDVVTAFCKYYRTHTNKLVYYHYDKTALDPHGASSHTYFQVVQGTLMENGWQVVPVYIGQTPSPKRRYEMIGSALRQGIVKLNPYNCRDLIQSMKLTEIREGKNGMEKNKSREGKVPPEEEVLNPHMGDAFDTLLWGRLVHLQTQGQVPLTSLFS